MQKKIFERNFGMRKHLSLLLIIIAGLMWGSSGVFSNLLSPYGFSSMQLTASRGIGSGIAIVLYVYFHNKSLFRVTQRQLAFFVVSGLAVFCTAASYYTAIQASSVSTAAVLMYTAPAFVMAYSVAFLGEKLTVKKGVCAALMLVGCMLVSGILSGLKFSFWGVFWGLLSGILYSAYSVLAKIEAMRGYHPLSATLYHFVTMGVVGLFFLDPSSYIENATKNPGFTIPLLIGIGIVTCVTPYLLFSISLREIPVGTASALGILEPVAATVYSVVFFKEQLDIPAIIGIVIVLGSCIFISQTDEKKDGEEKKDG